MYKQLKEIWPLSFSVKLSPLIVFRHSEASNNLHSITCLTYFNKLLSKESPGLLDSIIPTEIYLGQEFTVAWFINSSALLSFLFNSYIPDFLKQSSHPFRFIITILIICLVLYAASKPKILSSRRKKGGLA